MSEKKPAAAPAETPAIIREDRFGAESRRAFTRGAAAKEVAEEIAPW